MRQGRSRLFRDSSLAGGAALALALGLPAGASAHGLIQRANLPIPESLFAAAAAIVLVVSFAGLAALWTTPRLATDRWRPLPGGRVLGSPVLEAACGAIGVLLLAVVIAAGFDGSPNPLNNFACAFVFITFWVGMAFASALFGNVFAVFSPWRALGRLLRLTRARRPYPERLGVWPAAAGIAVFAWIELAAGWGNTPHTLAAAVVGYTIVTLGAQAVFGTEQWTRRGEAFAGYFGLLSRISPFERRDGSVGVRGALSGLARLEAGPGMVALLMVMIGSVTFDGFSSGSVWQNLVDGDDGVLVATLGLIACIAVVSGFYALGAGSDRRAYVGALAPIAMAYVAAHYLSYLAFEGQSIVYLASDPLGKGWDLFGTAASAINYGWLTQNQVWYLQVGCVVAGHVAGLVLSHDRALEIHGNSGTAVRSQQRMLLIMVGFTCLALWLLAAQA